MKKIICICILLGLLLLTACKNKEVLPTETEVAEVPTQTLPLDDLEILAPTEEIPTVTEKPDTLAVLEWGAYSGLFVEDGSDRTVEKVACLLIQNTTDQYVDYGIIEATFGEKNCRFVVTGLPGGSAAWVAEEGAQTVDSNDDFTYVDQSVSQLRELTDEEGIEVRFLNGELQVTNSAHVKYSQIRVYYKLLHHDGNFLGGITYTTATTEALEPGQTVTLTAGHSSESGCAVVRVDGTE